jgi:hypothetical protein
MKILKAGITVPKGSKAVGNHAGLKKKGLGYNP